MCLSQLFSDFHHYMYVVDLPALPSTHVRILAAWSHYVCMYVHVLVEMESGKRHIYVA